MKLIGSLALAGALLSAPVALTPAAATDANLAPASAECGLPCCDTCEACPCGTDCSL